MTAAPRGHALARNALLNLAGLALPLLAAVAAVPLLTASLGVARFGLLALAWALLEYLSLFDVGLTRATTQAVARTLDRPQTLRELVPVSITTIVAVSAAMGLLCILLAPALAELLGVPPQLSGEAIALFRVVGASVPVVLLLTALRGILEGAHRFDLSVAVKLPAALVAILIPAIGAAAGLSLPVLMLLVLVARVAIVAVLLRLVPRAIPDFSWQWPRAWGRLRDIGGFAAWASVSSIVSPLLVYVDRFLLSAVAGVAAAGYYAAPYETLSRLLIIPVSLAGVLFPAIATLHGDGTPDHGRAARLTGAALRQVFVAMVPILAVIAVFAPQLLAIWLGESFAHEAAGAVRVLAVGVLVNALAHIPYAYLQASGRPDIPARLHVFELVLHVPVTWWLVRQWGVTGAAAAWTLRVSLDALLLGVCAAVIQRRWGAGIQLMTSRGLLAVAQGSVLLALLATLSRVVTSLPVALAAAAVVVLLFLLSAWYTLLAPVEREALRRVLG